MTDRKQPKPWERRDTDTDKSWAAFCVYRDMGAGRSLQGVIDALCEGDNKATGRRRAGHVERWCSSNDWVARCRAYDEHVDRENLARVEEGREVAFRRLAGMRLKALRALEDMIDDPEQATGPRMAAVREVLDRTGIALPKGVDITSKGEKVDGGFAAVLAMTDEERASEWRRIREAMGDGDD